MSFAALKKASKTSVQALASQVEKEKSGGYQADSRYWKLEVDKAGVGSATIRFLPAPDGEEFPYVKRYEYFIKFGEKRFYAENCRTTLGEEDPVNKYFFEVRGDGSDEKKKIAARKYSRSTNYISNIYVVDDPKAPENNGKVFLYKYGTRIFGFCEQAIKPDFDDVQPFNPYDLWGGANFKLRARLVDGQRSYDKSAWEACGPLKDDDEELEAIWKQEYPLLPEIAPNQFKSYEELEKKFYGLLNGADKAGSGKGGSRSKDQEDDDTAALFKSSGKKSEEPDAPARRSTSKPAPKEDEQDEPPARQSKPARVAASSDADDMAEFRDFLNE